jgi:hypothetical protein
MKPSLGNLVVAVTAVAAVALAVATVIDRPPQLFQPPSMVRSFK